MRRLRLGLTAFATPTLRRLYEPDEAPMAGYARRFAAYEVAATADAAWDAQRSEALLALTPPGLRLLPRHPATADAAWVDRVRPLLRSPALGPIHLPVVGAWGASAHDRLERLLDALWDDLPPGGRVAVEFADPSWLRSDVMALLEMHEAILVWSTRAGAVPFRRTADPLYLRLTGHQTRRTGDEVQALLSRLRMQPPDDREVFVISALADQPYGITALERFARGMGIAWPTSGAPQQASLRRYAVPA